MLHLAGSRLHTSAKISINGEAHAGGRHDWSSLGLMKLDKSEGVFILSSSTTWVRPDGSEGRGICSSLENQRLIYDTNIVFRRRSPIHSLLLSKALDRFRSELNEDDESLFNVASVEDLLKQTKAMEPSATRGSKLPSSLARLEPILSRINDFAAVIAVCSGADMKTAGLVWGSLRMILMVSGNNLGEEKTRG